MTIANHTFEARQPNWLPPPAEPLGGPLPAQVVDENDMFSKGEIVSFYPHQGFGTLKNARGDNIEFRLSELDFIGPKKGPSFIASGVRVGFDVCRTSHGPHVSKLKLY